MGWASHALQHESCTAGKTLIARQIGKMLNGKEPKIVNGPEVLNKYVGASEENIRALFAEAEADQEAHKEYSELHVIIFDEIDAICKARGSVGGGSGVHDTVVNQLLTKIDGVDSLNNILLIGMTNRKDMLDEALLRPGRLEVQVEIGLADAKGRLQILKVRPCFVHSQKDVAPHLFGCVIWFLSPCRLVMFAAVVVCCSAVCCFQQLQRCIIHLGDAANYKHFRSHCFPFILTSASSVTAAVQILDFCERSSCYSAVCCLQQLKKRVIWLTHKHFTINIVPSILISAGSVTAAIHFLRMSF